MADYYKLIAQAVAGLDRNSDEARRAALYECARGALVMELCSLTPPITESEFTRECLSLEEAILKIEADAVHRPRAEAARSAPAPEPAERPQQELLSPEQAGPPIAGREPSPEPYVRPAKIPELDSFEPRTKPNPQRISVRPLLPRMSEVELTMGTSIGEGINSYTLDKPVADLSHGSLWEFCDFEYAACRKDFGIQRKLPGEVFYRAADNVFLAKQSVPAIVAALNGKVCRIYFGFAHMTDEECWEFLRKAGDYLGAKYGSPSDTHEINRECKWVSWDRSFGKVFLETDSFWRRSALIYTSSALRPQNITWFRRIFGNR